MRPGSDLQFDYVPLTERPLPRWEAVLGAAVFDGEAGGAALAEAADIPLAQVRMPVLDSRSGVCEIWRTNAAARSGRHGVVHYRHDEQYLFGCLSLLESDLQPTASASPLQQVTHQAYRELYSTVHALEYPHLVRIWNYLPRINFETHGIERYRQFNAARREALLASGREIVGNVPAACALGSATGSALAVYFLASRRAPHVIENPRQVSAYEYPPQYGTSPAFSRACILPQLSGGILFISGTASIIGHESRHPGDVGAQTAETLRNIQALLGEANRTGVARFDLASLACKVYVRDAADLPAIRAHLARALGERARLLYLQADVCREDLLVEIEAVGTGRQ